MSFLNLKNDIIVSLYQAYFEQISLDRHLLAGIGVYHCNILIRSSQMENSATGANPQFTYWMWFKYTCCVQDLGQLIPTAQGIIFCPRQYSEV